MFSNNKLRLLMTLIRFERLGAEDVLGASWAVPSALTSKDLRESKSSIDACLASPITEYNGQDPHQLLRRKENGETRGSSYQSTLDIDFGSDSEGGDVPDGPLFPPNPRSKSKALDELKKRRKRRRQGDNEGESLDEETLEERRRERLTNALARQAKIKSDLYIHASDEETDEEANREFFLLEEKRRQAQSERIKEALRIGAVNDALGKTGKGKGRKRKSEEHSAWDAAAERKRQRGNDSDDDVVMADAESLLGSPQREISLSRDTDDLGNTPDPGEDDIDFDDDLAFSRDRHNRPGSSALAVGVKSSVVDATADSQDEDGDAPVAAPSRRRIRSGFVIDSDSE